LTGCGILFEQELYRFFSPDPPVEATGSPRLSDVELTRIATVRYPEHRVIGIWKRKISADTVAELWLEGPDGITMRLLHPYTAADLGDAQPPTLRALAMLRRAHVSLLTGPAGRTLNGIGALFLLALALSGTSLWRSRRNRPKGASKSGVGRAERLHRRIGGCMLIFAVMWGVTGALFTLPGSWQWSHGEVSQALYALHTGSIGGWPARVVWAASGLLTSFLVIVGLWAWWQKAAHL